MTKQFFDDNDFEEIMERLNEERDEITTYEVLKEYAISQVNDDNFVMAIHILDALNKERAEWYDYDFCMGILDYPSTITEKLDVAHLVDED
ncbi:MAG: hypothetical protein RR063_11705 [Anaerovoracaceae bacterium]